MGNAINSFFRFVLGFSLFVAASLGLAFAVSTYAIKKDRAEQTASAFKAMLNQSEEKEWWELWK
jgi:hypothetical protein